MTTIRNDFFLKALAREKTPYTPIWLMRQAGRYLPEYQRLRSSAPDFMAFCKNPELAMEATLQPLARFPLDAAIIFSDILTIPDAMGLDLQLVENIGPVFNNPITHHSQIENLATPDPNRDLQYVMNAIALAKRELTVPLIGFSGSPWTLACYMVEGKGSKDFIKPRALLYQESAAAHALLTKLTEAIILYCQAQVEAGADVIMIFDTWGGLLATDDYIEFSLQYMQHIVEALKPLQKPTILFTKNGGHWLENMASSGCSALGIDWTLDMSQAIERVGNHVALQGNLDPAVLLASPDTVKQAAVKILKQVDYHPGFIFNLGHGINQHTAPENVAALIEAVHNY